MALLNICRDPRALVGPGTWMSSRMRTGRLIGWPDPVGRGRAITPLSFRFSICKMEIKLLHLLPHQATTSFKQVIWASALKVRV